MTSPARPRLRRRLVVPLAAVAVVGAVGGAVALSGYGDTASAGSSAASVAGYIPASSPLYVQISTDTRGPQWTQLVNLAKYFPSYGAMQAEVEKALLNDGVSWQKDLQPLLGDAAAVAVPGVGDTSAVAKGALTDPAGAGGRALAAAADQPMLAVLQIAPGKEDQVKMLLSDPATGGVKASGEYNGATLYFDPANDEFAAIAPEALIVGSSEAVVKQAIDVHAAGGDQALSGVFRFNDALALLPTDTFAMAYVNVDALGKAAGDALPMAENLMGGQVTGAAAMSLTAEPGGIRMKAVLVDAPPLADQKAFAPTLTKNAPASAVAYLGFNRLANTVQRVMASASESASADTKRKIDAITGQLPLLLGVTGDDLTNLAGGEHAVVVTQTAGQPAVALALETANGANATVALTELSKSVPAVLGQFGPKSVKKAASKGFRPVDLGGVKGKMLPINADADVVWGVKGDLAVIGSRAGAVASILNPTPGASLATNASFTAATAGMPNEVTGLAWINVQQAIPMLARAGMFQGKDGARTRQNLSHITSVTGWGTQGPNPTVEVFVGMKK